MNDEKLFLEQIHRIIKSLEEYPDKSITIKTKFDLEDAQDEHGAPCFTPTGYRTVTIKYYLP